MMKSRISIRLILGLFLLLVLLAASGCGSSDAPIPGTYTISGTVTANGSALPNVIITLSDGATNTTTTDASGNYSFTGLLDGSYTVTPSLTGYMFDPNSSAVVVSGANATSNFVATVVFSQADLAGTWKVQGLLNSGGVGAWIRFTAEIDPEGFFTISESEDSVGGEVAPPDGTGVLQWTINQNGEISTLGNDGSGYVLEQYMKGRMTLGKNLVAITQGPPLDGYSVLMIAQKVVTGTEYENALLNKSIVMHQLTAEDNWGYADGSIDGASNLSFNLYTGPDGSFEDIPGGDLLLDSNGNVTTTTEGVENYKGFLSADKKTIVSTATAGGQHLLQIFQFTGASTGDPDPAFTPGLIPTGTYSSHLMGVAEDASFWVRSLFTMSDLGIRSFSASDWLTNKEGSVTAPTGYDLIGIIDTSGTVKTTLNSSYHGQMSADGMFIVRTQTHAYDDTTYYSLGIDMRMNGAPAAGPN